MIALHRPLFIRLMLFIATTRNGGAYIDCYVRVLRLILSVCFVTKRYILQQNFGQPLDKSTLPFLQNC